MAHYRALTHRAAHPKIFVWAHTQKAEIEYFQEYKNYLKSHLLVPKKILCRSPTELLDRVLIWKSQQEAFIEDQNDQVWCVFDVDDFYNTDKLALLKAVNKAEENKIRIAYSNECFELWILLHFELASSKVTRGSAIEKKIQSHFAKNHLGKYFKNKEVFRQLLPFQNTAIKNAKKLLPKYSKPNWEKLFDPSGCPSTSIHLLIEQINDSLRK